ncbi:MAG: hypothetical protein JO307_07595 [Bryobacterales bacterium]|nr:hypothetical protein [Bryobacterales bacterium]
MPQARVAHHVRGRIRVKVPAVKGNRAALEHFRSSVSAIPGVQRVETNPTTGSFIVHYDPGRQERFEQRHFEEQLRQHATDNQLFDLIPPELSEVDELARNIEREAEFLSEHSETALHIVNGFRLLDRTLKRATDNTVDLKVLLPLGLAVYSFLEVGVDASTPMWLTLGIFSFHSFVSLHTPHRVTGHPVLAQAVAVPAAPPKRTPKRRAPKKS